MGALGNWRPYNSLLQLKSLAAEFYVMRHGRSLANEQDLIVSDPVRGADASFALTAVGKMQVRSSARVAFESGYLDGRSIIFSSPFSRALESAELLREVLGADEIRIDSRLRERFFGELNLTAAAKGYEQVWELDRQNAGHNELGVESTFQVLARVTDFFLEMHTWASQQSENVSLKIVAVCHGDTAQISQMGFLKRDPGEHRSLPPLELGEIRQLRLVG